MAWLADVTHRYQSLPRRVAAAAAKALCRQKTLKVDRPVRYGTIAAGFKGLSTLMRGILTLTILAATIASASANAAETQNNREAYYRCKDAKGQNLYGDTMPVGCNGFDTEVLNSHGTVMRVIEGDQTRASRLSRELADKKERQAREQRQMRDRMLLETYLSVEDIERLRDQRLELLAAQYRGTEQTIANMRERQGQLEGRIARFKPYNPAPNAPPLPDHLGEEIVNAVKGMKVYEESLAKNRAEQAAVKTTFGADIKRFKELKGIR